MAKLYVKRVRWTELHDHWGKAAETLGDDFLYSPGLVVGPVFGFIRCNKDGVVNWAKAPLYEILKLVERNDVKLFDSQDILD